MNFLRASRIIPLAAICTVGYGAYRYDKKTVQAAEMQRIEKIQKTVPKALIISGPSGVGKGTLITKVFHDYPDNFGFSISHTTRKPRPGERDGVDYYFVSEQVMKEKIEKGEFLEHACVYGKYYGTSIKAYEDVANAGKICVFDIDVQGARNLKNSKKFTNPPHSLFILPPSNEELERRLRGRGTENEETISRRLKNSFDEIEYAKKPGNYDYVLVNNNLDNAYSELMNVLRKWYPHLPNL